MVTTRTLTAGTGISVTDNGTLVTIAGTRIDPVRPSGSWYVGGFGAGGPSYPSPVSDEIHWGPIWLADDTDIDLIGVKTNIAYTAGTLRLGAYQLTDVETLDLLFEGASTIDLSTAAGAKSVSVSPAETLPAGWVYLVAMFESCTVGAGNIVGWVSQGPSIQGLPEVSNTYFNYNRGCGLRRTSMTTGSLPASYDLSSPQDYVTNQIVQIGVRVA